MTEYSRPPSFDFGAATLQGFNLPGGRSYLIRIAAWTAALVTLLYVVLGTPVVKAYVDVFQNAIDMEFNLDGSAPDNEAVFAMLAPMFRAMGFFFLIFLGQIALFTSAETAIYRNLFHKEDRGIFPLTFGVDELRVFGTRLVVGIILGAAYMAVYFAAFLIGAILIGLAGATGSSVLAAIGGILIFFLVLAAIAAFVWGAIRLAPASAYSVKHQAFNPMASWAPMNGFVWPAIGSFLILYLVGYFVLMFFASLIFLILFMSSGILGALMKMETSSEAMPDFSPVLDQVSSAGFLIPLVIAIFIGLFFTMIWYGMIWSMWGHFAKIDGTDVAPKALEDISSSI